MEGVTIAASDMCEGEGDTDGRMVEIDGRTAPGNPGNGMKQGMSITVKD